VFAAITNLKLKQEHFDRTVSVSKSESYQQRFVKSKGFVKAIYYANKDSDDFGSITVWESKEDFEEYSGRAGFIISSWGATRNP